MRSKRDDDPGKDNSQRPRGRGDSSELGRDEKKSEGGDGEQTNRLNVISIRGHVRMSAPTATVGPLCTTFAQCSVALLRCPPARLSARSHAAFGSSVGNVSRHKTIIVHSRYSPEGRKGGRQEGIDRKEPNQEEPDGSAKIKLSFSRMENQFLTSVRLEPILFYSGVEMKFSKYTFVKDVKFSEKTLKPIHDSSPLENRQRRNSRQSCSDVARPWQEKRTDK